MGNRLWDSEMIPNRKAKETKRMRPLTASECPHLVETPGSDPIRSIARSVALALVIKPTCAASAAVGA